MAHFLLSFSLSVLFKSAQADRFAQFPSVYVANYHRLVMGTAPHGEDHCREKCLKNAKCGAYDYSPYLCSLNLCDESQVWIDPKPNLGTRFRYPDHMVGDDMTSEEMVQIYCWFHKKTSHLASSVVSPPTSTASEHHTSSKEPSTPTPTTSSSSSTVTPSSSPVSTAPPSTATSSAMDKTSSATKTEAPTSTTPVATTTTSAATPLDLTPLISNVYGDGRRFVFTEGEKGVAGGPIKTTVLGKIIPKNGSKPCSCLASLTREEDSKDIYPLSVLPQSENTNQDIVIGFVALSPSCCQASLAIYENVGRIKGGFRNYAYSEGAAAPIEGFTMGKNPMFYIWQ